MKVGNKVIFLIILLAGNRIGAQNNSSIYPQNYFRNPLGVPIQLAANFGELRSNHFHMGLDIRTQQRENLPVYAAADGYISRVRVAESGFGNALYVTHPAGYTTLYAHLNTFSPEVEEYLKDRQYESEKWEIDLRPESGKFKVSKGQLIAYSGNTGASQGPHLHFEVYDDQTGYNLNPELFGLPITDNISPRFYSLYVYDRRYSTYLAHPEEIGVYGKGNIYNARSGVIESGSQLVSLGIRAEDKNNDSPFMFGIFQAELWMDDSLLHAFQMNNIGYENTRYINASMDYNKWMNGRRGIQHLSTLPGNKLNIYSEAGSNGIIILQDTALHDIKIVISDVSGNTSELNCKIRYNPAKLSHKAFPDNTTPLVPGRAGEVKSEHAIANFSENAFYDVVPFKISEVVAQNNNQVSPTIYLHNYLVPVHDYYTVGIKPSMPAFSALIYRTVMELNSGPSRYLVKPEIKGEYLQGSFNKLGMVRLLVDTVPPNISFGLQNATVSNGRILQVRCTDNLNETQQFRAEANGQWLLFKKSGTYYTYKVDEHCPEGRFQLTISVTDIAGNKTTQTYTLTKN